MIILTTVYLLCSIIYAIIGITILKNDHRSGLNRIFFAIGINLSLWALLFALINRADNPETASMLRTYSAFTWGSFYSMVLHFFIVLTNKNKKLLRSRMSYTILYLPTAITIYLHVIQNSVAIEEAVKISVGWAFINVNRGVVHTYFHSVYSLLYAGISIGLLCFWTKDTEIKREKYQGQIIIISMLIVTIAGSITDIIFPILGRSVPSIAIVLILVPVSGIWYSIKKYRLMNLNPQNVLLGVLKTMADGVLVLNRHDLIIDTNEGALNLLGYEESQLINRDIKSIIPYNKEISLEGDCSSLEMNLLKKDNELLPVLFSSSTLRDNWGDKLGSVYIFQDISEIKIYQDKLRNAYDDLEKRVNERTIELSNANRELENEVKKRIIMEEEIRTLALYDHLTGLPNRTLFNERLKKAISNAQVNRSTLAVLFLDLDLFKMVNDTFGHTWGDELLKIVSTRLQSILRDVDTVARVGGDEFIILIDNPPEENYVQGVAERILNSIKQSFKFNSNEIYITVSIGIAIYPSDGKDAETLVKNADIAMYKSKELGKNKFQFCDNLMKSTVYEEMKLTNYLYQALERDELELYYQPQVNIDTGEIVGLEALIRWYHPELGFISPRYFIPIAEKTGLIVFVGEWVLRNACKQNKIWQDKGLLNVPVAVNLSVNQFANNKIVKQIENILIETGLSAEHLDLEVTERIFMKDNDYIIRTLEQLKNLGVTISIDDFGTEYSSLNYLKTLPLDKIKIAMEFVSGINKNKKDEAIISAMIVLGKNLGLKVIAEGVETEEQSEFLREHMCDEIQGYYYYRPMTAEGIEEILDDSTQIIIHYEGYHNISNE